MEKQKKGNSWSEIGKSFMALAVMGSMLAVAGGIAICSLADDMRKHKKELIKKYSKASNKKLYEIITEKIEAGNLDEALWLMEILKEREAKEQK